MLSLGGGISRLTGEARHGPDGDGRDEAVDRVLGGLDVDGETEAAGGGGGDRADAGDDRRAVRRAPASSRNRSTVELEVNVMASASARSAS